MQHTPCLFPASGAGTGGAPDAGESPGRDFCCAPASERTRGKTGKRRRLLSAPADFGRGGGCFSALHFCPAGSEGIAFLPFLPPRSGEGGEMNAPPRGFSFFRQAFLQKGRYLPACSGTVLLRHKGRHPPRSFAATRPRCGAHYPALRRRRRLPHFVAGARPRRVSTTPAPRRPATASPRAAATGKSLKILKRSPV